MVARRARLAKGLDPICQLCFTSCKSDMTWYTAHSCSQPTPLTATRCASADSTLKQQKITSAMPGDAAKKLATVPTAIRAARSIGKR